MADFDGEAHRELIGSRVIISKGPQRSCAAAAHPRPDPRGTCTSRVQPAALYTGKAVSGPVADRLQASGRGVGRRPRDLRGLRGVRKEKILHTAESMFHDHKPANDHGLKSCWIYRRHDKEGFGATMNPGQMPHFDFRFTSMHELVTTHQEQLRVK